MLERTKREMGICLLILSSWALCPLTMLQDVFLISWTLDALGMPGNKHPYHVTLKRRVKT